MGSGGRAVAAPSTVVFAAAVVTLAMMASGARADCFDYCYKNCIANDKSMADYCNYACDKTCEPGLLAGVVGSPLLPIRCQIDCVRRSCTGFRKDRKGVVACYRGCFDGCKTKTVPRPLRAGSGVDAGSGPVMVAKRGDAVVRPKSEPIRSGVDSGSGRVMVAKRDDAVRPKSEPVRSDVNTGSGPVMVAKRGDAVRPKSEPVRSDVDTGSGPVMVAKKGDAVRPKSEPVRSGVDTAGSGLVMVAKRGDAVRPKSEPVRSGVDTGSGPASMLDHPFHEKQDTVQPAAVPDHPFHEKQDAVEPVSMPDHP